MPRKGQIKEGKVCPRCNIYKPRGDFMGKHRKSNLMSHLCNICSAQSSKEYRLNNPDTRRESKRRTNLKSKFGITVEEYDTILERQRGVCAICGIKPEKMLRGGVSIRLAVDHCHDTGMIRGLLCANCNRAIGQLGDSRERVESALKYLTKGVSSTLLREEIEK